MNKNKINKHNTLIAEFDGWVYTEFLGDLSNDYIVTWLNSEKDISFSGGDSWSLERFQAPFYNTSWDWLMPIVEKINNTKINNVRYEIIIFKNAVHLCNSIELIYESNEKSLIDSVYNTVVYFINLYNSKINEGTKDLKYITEDEVKHICELVDEPYISYMTNHDGKWDNLNLELQICTTSTMNNNSKYDSYITIYKNGIVELSRNDGSYGGFKNYSINAYKITKYLIKQGYVFKL